MGIRLMEKARIYYLSPQIIVMDNPCDGGCPVVVLRHKGTPLDKDWELIRKVLSLCNMELVGESNFRPDGLWYHTVIGKEVKDGREELSNRI